MTKHIRIITPHTTPRPAKLDELAGLSDKADLRFSHVGLEFGPASIESAFDEVLCAPYVVGCCIEAQQQRVDAVIIDCMGEPGLEAAHEAVTIPVLGPGETSLHVAAMLGHRFGVVTILDRVRPTFENHARIYASGLPDRHSVSSTTAEIIGTGRLRNRPGSARSQIARTTSMPSRTFPNAAKPSPSGWRRPPWSNSGWSPIQTKKAPAADPKERRAMERAPS